MRSDSLQELERKISESMQYDQHRLRELVRTVRRAGRRGESNSKQLAQLVQLLETSTATCARRRSAAPAVELDPELPIAAKQAEIAAAVRAHSVVVVCGETGSGKSTQLPKICLQVGRGVRGLIGHTQPRRLAARSIAARLAQELNTSVGGDVGFKIRFADTVKRGTYVKLMTDGILLAETQHDRFLDQYDTIIVDEAHERSLNVDFLLGYLKRLLPKRPDLRLIITSATIDAARFAEHFSREHETVPVIQVAGRCYPVETRYREPDEQAEEDSPVEQIAAALEELEREPRGDVLVFLATEREIRETARHLRGWSLARQNRPEILPLYARLSAADQNRVFQPSGRRRIVLATNVAESSLTVPGIRYVVDTGTARISRYSPRSKVQRLPIEPVSRASADQRQGRCGRVAPGVCIRLYSSGDYEARDPYSTPEIRRTNLAAVILQMLALRLGDVNRFPFLDRPHPEAVRDGYKTLFELGAVDGDRRITRLGRQMSRLPVDPRIARMILAADEENCLAEILIIAAALEIQDPRERPADKQEQADQCHVRFADERSDFLSYIKLWDFFHHLKAELSRNQVRKACRQNFLSYMRLREWQDVHRQIKQLVAQIGLPQLGTRRDRDDVTGESDPQRSDRYAAIHRTLLAGLLSNIAMRTERFEYQACGGAKSFLWPGSGLREKRPLWVVAAEAVETSQRFLRTVAEVDPRWIEARGEHLVKRSYRDPYWSRRRATVLAHEKVTLFGLTIAADRRVAYGRIDPRASRDLFIEHALVANDVVLKADFYRHNRQVIEQLEALAAKTRRAGLLVSERAQLDFYHQRLPDEVYDVATLQAWLKRGSPDAIQRLRMSVGELVPDGSPQDHAADAFPEKLRVGDLTLPIDYRYEPGDENDGASVTIPLEAGSQVDPDSLEWGVPGLLEEKLLALIRALPKALRRSLVPAPESARRAAGRVKFGSGPFLPAVASVLSDLAGEPIPTEAFDLQRLPQHLRVNVRVVDPAGKLVAQGRDPRQLRNQLPLGNQQQPRTIRESAWERDGITDWDFDELPAEIRLTRGGVELTAFPQLVDDGKTVSMALSDDRQSAACHTATAIGRLVCLAEARQLKSQVNWLPRLSEFELFAATLPYRLDLRADLSQLLAKLAYVGSGELPRTREEYQEMLRRGRQQLPVVVQDVAKLLPRLWDGYHQVSVSLEEIATQERWADTADDVRTQLAGLTGPGFLVATPWHWLQHYPRYFKGVLFRIEKLSQSGHPRDVECQAQLRPFSDAYRKRQQMHALRGIVDNELELFRWMLEEFRVSLFAQPLGTATKVSAQRLEKQWAKVKTQT